MPPNLAVLLYAQSRATGGKSAKWHKSYVGKKKTSCNIDLRQDWIVQRTIPAPDQRRCTRCFPEVRRERR